MEVQKQFEEELKAIYSAPAPVRKDAFLKQHRRREIGMWDFIQIQGCYISKIAWIGSLVLFAVSLLFVRYLDGQTIWAIASLMPAFAVLLLVENGRSARYGMEELELSSRFSLCVVGMARLAAIGIRQLLLFLILPPIFVFCEIGTILQGITYLLVPYLLSVTIGLMVSRQLNGKDAIYGCIGAALFVDFIQFVAYTVYPLIYDIKHQLVWVILLVGAMILSAWQLKATGYGMEELKWNWSPVT